MKFKAEAMKDLARVLRHKIVIEEKEVYQDEAGEERANWKEWRTVWGEREDLWGQDYFAAATLGQEQIIGFVVRYAPFLDKLKATERYRVRYHDDVYDIKQVDYLKDDGMWVKIKVLKRR